MTRLGIFLIWLLHFLPLSLQAIVGNVFGLLLFWFANERRRVADINLHLCFPEMTEAERYVLVKRHFQVFARSLLERGILWWSPKQRIQKLIRVIGREHLQAVENQPVILLAPHFVGLDIGGSWMTQHVNLVSVYSNQKSPLFHNMLLSGGVGYEIQIYPAWENYPTEDSVADTRRMNEFIEQRVREMPEQYFWLHKRFKTRPEGEKSFY